MSDTNNENSCIQKPCQSNQSGYPNTGLDDRNPDLSERPVLYTGVLWIGVSQIQYLNHSFTINKQFSLNSFILQNLFEFCSCFSEIRLRMEACDKRNGTGFNRRNIFDCRLFRIILFPK